MIVSVIRKRRGRSCTGIWTKIFRRGLVLIVVVVVVLLLLLRNHIGVLEVVPAALGGLLVEARIFGVDGILLEWRRRLLDYWEAVRWELLLELLLLWNKRRRVRFKLSIIIVTCGLNLLRAMTIG